MNQRLREIIGALSPARCKSQDDRRERMSLSVRSVAIPFLALIVVVGASACSKQEPTKKAETAPVAPVTAGYESAIAAHAMKPIFRPNGTAPAF